MLRPALLALLAFGFVAPATTALVGAHPAFRSAVLAGGGELLTLDLVWFDDDLEADHQVWYGRIEDASFSGYPVWAYGGMMPTDGRYTLRVVGASSSGIALEGSWGGFAGAIHLEGALWNRDIAVDGVVTTR